MLTLQSQVIQMGNEGAWLLHKKVYGCLNACMFFLDVGFCEYTWRKRHVAGSPSMTEKLFEAFAFDVCPTTQRNLLLWAVSLLVVWWQQLFSPFISHHIQTAAYYVLLLFFFFFCFPSSKLLVLKKTQVTLRLFKLMENLQKRNIALKLQLPFHFCCSFQPSDPSNR